MSDCILLQDKSAEWLLNLLYQANKSDVETYRVYKTYVRYINDNRNFIGIIENATDKVLRFKPLTDVADDCLFAVTFFKRAIRRKRDTRGAPGVKYYANVGRSAFKTIGYPMISRNWDFWVSYVNKNVKLDK